jgi:hypothetical protein
MRVATFKAKCASCRSEFAHPSLGELSYGNFLFTGTNGTVFCYFNALGHPIWDLVDRTLSSVLASADRGAAIQATCAALADPQDDQSFLNSRVCPSCRSSDWEWWEGEKVGEVEVPDATFNRISSLSRQDQVAAVLACAGGHAA